MADLTNSVVGANYEKLDLHTSDGGKEYIIELYAQGDDISNFDLQQVFRQLSDSTGDGTGSALSGADAGTWITFGGWNGKKFYNVNSHDTLYIRWQGTGAPNLSTITPFPGFNITLRLIAVLTPVANS